MAAIRTFIAIELEETLRARLGALQDDLRAAGAGIAWVRPEGMHITLKFLGDVAEERMPDLGDVLVAVAARHAPFTLRLAGAGAFPDLRHPRIIWAGIYDGGDPLCALAAAVEEALVAQGFPPEARPFRPHITLGRVKDPRDCGRLADMTAAHAADALGAMTVTQLAVMRSDLTPQGANYTALRQLPLGG